MCYHFVKKAYLMNETSPSPERARETRLDIQQNGLQESSLRIECGSFTFGDNSHAVSLPLQNYLSSADMYHLCCSNSQLKKDIESTGFQNLPIKLPHQRIPGNFLDCNLKTTHLKIAAWVRDSDLQFFVDKLPNLRVMNLNDADIKTKKWAFGQEFAKKIKLVSSEARTPPGCCARLCVLLFMSTCCSLFYFVWLEAEKSKKSR